MIVFIIMLASLLAKFAECETKAQQWGCKTVADTN